MSISILYNVLSIQQQQRKRLGINVKCVFVWPSATGKIIIFDHTFEYMMAITFAHKNVNKVCARQTNRNNNNIKNTIYKTEKVSL